MNEQLIVKNFGPIKDATVDFKRVTVFIGPTGGGKSTLAKLAAVFRDERTYFEFKSREFIIEYYSMGKYSREGTLLQYKSKNIVYSFDENLTSSSSSNGDVTLSKDEASALEKDVTDVKNKFDELLQSIPSLDIIADNPEYAKDKENAIEYIKKLGNILARHKHIVTSSRPYYIPSERTFLPSIEYSWAGLLRDDIGLPKSILQFANDFSTSRKSVQELSISFFNIKYIHQNGQDFIEVPGVETLFRLYETASGIQSVTPLLVLLEHLSRSTEQAQSFIIEEPELNLYPTAQQGLLNWLVEKCTKGENDLTLTTHSPYILSHLNLLLYAHHVGNKDEEKRQKVAAIIPEKYWVNPDEFAAYYVNGPEGAGGVRSLLDPETKLISQNELDAVSGIQADEFDQLLDINRGF
ncbi:MAG: hypothetical protein EOO60_04430 [Hymenobacter sp.]|nr:MAG: hypothetical protein EOO60_04430 [Hymenobacter sp.]